MKIIILTLLALIACTSPETKKKVETWDSGANKTRSFNDERSSQRDETARDQFPRPAPATNQNPF